MDSTELLNRIKKHDMGAYLQLTRDYGLKLYSHLREHCDDKELTDAAFNRTLDELYRSLTADDDQDTLEAILYAYGDRALEQTRKEKGLPVKEKKKSAGKGSFALGVVLLSVGILIALWVILGLLMDLHIIPMVDLGYSWFNTNVANWF